MDHCNSNGLVHGNIPAGKPCPFIGDCGYRNEGCPSESALKPHPFSCGAARLHSMIELSKKPAPMPAWTKEEIVIHDDDGYTD